MVHALDVKQKNLHERTDKNLSRILNPNDKKKRIENEVSDMIKEII